MKLHEVQLLLVISFSIATDTSGSLIYNEGDRYSLISDESGRLHLVDLAVTDLSFRFVPEEDLNFYLYTKSNPITPQVVAYRDVDSLVQSNYNKSKTTKIVAHGWSGTAFEKTCNWIKDAYMQELDVNLFCLDWSIPAAALYPTSVKYVPEVGRFTANFTDWLVEQGSRLDDFHLIGHSLGGHIVGATGRSVLSGKVPYISVLDPAGPLWDSPESGRVRPSDGAYVEALHTNAHGLGLWDAVGDADFYPNGGERQPGCLSVDVSCHHGRSVAFFAHSIDHERFAARRCASLDEVATGACSGEEGASHMGGATPKREKGIFTLTTTSTPPYYETVRNN